MGEPQHEIYRRVCLRRTGVVGVRIFGASASGYSQVNHRAGREEKHTACTNKACFKSVTYFEKPLPSLPVIDNTAKSRSSPE